MASFQAVIFDMNGVMVDTENLVFQAFQQVLSRYGMGLNSEQQQRIVGMDRLETAEYVARVTGFPGGGRALDQEHWPFYMETLDEQLKPLPGLVELLDRLVEAGCALAVASNSDTDYIVRVLNAIHLRWYFQAVAGREMVKEGKPAPDVYLLAARLLGVSPQYCLAIEDSLPGVQSALAAGMRCIMVAAELPPGIMESNRLQRVSSLQAIDAKLILS